MMALAEITLLNPCLQSEKERNVRINDGERFIRRPSSAARVCIAVFDALSAVETDRGAHFESTLFQTLLNFLGCTLIQTTAYNLAANGMVEGFQLKTTLRAMEDLANWSDNLLLVLHGIRSALRSDLVCHTAELVFNTTFGLPGEMITPTANGAD
ncbi:hypothetical protein SprV_0401436200 [Sparganum proliferum]